MGVERETHDVSAPNTLATWTYFLGQMVANGSARIIRGVLPVVTGEPRLHLISKPKPSESAQLAAAFDRFTSEQSRQTDALLALVASLTPKKA